MFVFIVEHATLALTIKTKEFILKEKKNDSNKKNFKHSLYLLPQIIVKTENFINKSTTDNLQ